MSVNVRVYLPIRERLHRSLRKEWSTKSKKFLRGIRAAVRNGSLDDILAAVEAIDMSSVLTKRVKKDIRLVTEMIVLFGVSRVVTPSRSVYKDSNQGREFIDIGIEQVESLIAVADTELKTRLQKIVMKEYTEQALNDATIIQKVGDLKLTNDFSLALGEIVGKSGNNMLELTSSLHTTRMANYGFTVEARLRDIVTYEITAVLDDRTSGVCRVMDGKRFKVEDGARSVEEQLRITDPDELRRKVPWPAQDRLSLKNLGEMSSDEIVSNNWHLPPYHPNCRTIIVRAATEQVGTVDPDNGIDNPFLPTAPRPQRNIRVQEIGNRLNVPQLTNQIVNDVNLALQQGLNDLEILATLGISMEVLTAAKTAIDELEI